MRPAPVASAPRAVDGSPRRQKVTSLLASVAGSRVVRRAPGRRRCRAPRRASRSRRLRRGRVRVRAVDASPVRMAARTIRASAAVRQ